MAIKSFLAICICFTFSLRTLTSHRSCLFFARFWQLLTRFVVIVLYICILTCVTFDWVTDSLFCTCNSTNYIWGLSKKIYQWTALFCWPVFAALLFLYAFLTYWPFCCNTFAINTLLALFAFDVCAFYFVACCVVVSDYTFWFACVTLHLKVFVFSFFIYPANYRVWFSYEIHRWTVFLSWSRCCAVD